VPGFRRSPLEPLIFEEFKNLVLSSGEPIQAWVEYDALKSLPNLTLAPFYTSQPNLPLLSLDIDISPIILPQVYVQGVVRFYREGGFGKVYRGVLPVSIVQVQ